MASRTLGNDHRTDTNARANMTAQEPILRWMDASRRLRGWSNFTVSQDRIYKSGLRWEFISDIEARACLRAGFEPKSDL